MYSGLQAWIQIRHVLDFDCRYRKVICTVGFEPNLMHQSRLKDLQESYRKCGWKAKTDFVFYVFVSVFVFLFVFCDSKMQVAIMMGVGVGAEEKNLQFVHR